MTGINDHPYIEELIKNCLIAKQSNTVNRSEIVDIMQLKSIQIRNAVYIIEEIGGNVEKTFKNFKDFKSNSDYACAKLNQPNNYLYVGSSSTGVKNRLNQHLNKGPKGTYALHMSKWFKGKYKVTILEYDVEREVLQIIEDSISYNLRPAFGKQGGNNK